MQHSSCHEKSQCCSSRLKVSDDEDIIHVHVDDITTKEVNGDTSHGVLELNEELTNLNSQLSKRNANLEKQNQEFEKNAVKLQQDKAALEKENEMLALKLQELENEQEKMGNTHVPKFNHRIVLPHATTHKAMVSDEDLHAAFSGQAGHGKMQSDSGEGHDPCADANHFAWVLALALPNPAKAPPSKSISRQNAMEIFSRCFNGEEVREEGTLRQTERFAKEKSIFLDLFDDLPEVKTGKGKVYGGEHSSDGKASSFLELMRNVLIAKLVLHCGLHVRTVVSEDEESILLLVTATEDEVLREADRVGFPAELDLHSVDPLSMEPCTRTFYPLLHWFFRHRPVAPDDPLISAYRKVLAMIRASSEEDKKRHSGEIAFYQEARIDVHRITKSIEGSYKSMKDPQESRWVSWIPGWGRSQRSNNCEVSEPVTNLENENAGPDGEKESSLNDNANAEDGELAHFLHHFKEQFEGFGGEEMFDPTIHIGPQKKVEETHDVYLRYLELKAEEGLGACSLEVQAKVNMEARLAKKRARLQNLYDRLGLECFHPFRAFRMTTYLAPSSSSEWRKFALPSQTTDKSVAVPFNGQQIVKLVKGIIDRQIDMGQLQQKELIFSSFPLDTREKLVDPGTGNPSDIAKCWSIPDSPGAPWLQVSAFQKTLLKFPAPTHLRSYFGEAIAMYFAFVQTLSKWLIGPSIFGLFTFVCQRMQRDAASPIRIAFDLTYALTLTLWGCLILEVWNRRECVLNVSWGGGVHGVAHGGERPSFRGAIRRSPVNYQDTDEYFPEGCRGFGRFGRLPRQIGSYLVILIIAMGQVWISHKICEFRGQWVDHPEWTLHSLASEITAIFSSMQMSLFGLMGRALAEFFNHCENYKTNNKYIDNLIFKRFVFEFVNRFNVFFYIAFAKALTEGCIEEDTNGVLRRYPAQKGGWRVEDDTKMCLYELQYQMLIVFCVQISQCMLQLAVPWVRRWAMIAQLSIPAFAVDEAMGRARMSHFVQNAMEKQEYGSMEVDGTFEDYLQIMINFGHVTLFSTVFPLAPALGLLLMILEMRVDGLKLFHLLRRPWPRHTSSIGRWKFVLQTISWISIITNTALVVWAFGCFDTFQFSFPRTRYALMVLLSLFIFKASLVLIPNVPERVHIIQKHHDFIRESLHHGQSRLTGRVVPFSALDLSVEDIHTGAMHDPLEFGISPEGMQTRISKLVKKQQKPTGDVFRKVLKVIFGAPGRGTRHS
eukprot:gnl/MRDRNA2_/MRDRNA2_27342_c0_seq1.p1 gnl/MRDRNA2_/MRDRNA2_27342_c0~~gnl/MRDRNA2_/MRDRNA2_27342_c0_seq1.p1  ORF type:complete len:1226 (-),score=193.14 gnl/MRDRNA2_/MRDRNA2_27342_c0_seq1:114-3791(-)